LAIAPHFLDVAEHLVDCPSVGERFEHLGRAGLGAGVREELGPFSSWTVTIRITPPTVSAVVRNIVTRRITSTPYGTPVTSSQL
jgi:hypothetical protein